MNKRPTAARSSFPVRHHLQALGYINTEAYAASSAPTVSAALAMTGSFVVERVFTVPGLGQHFVNAVLNKDLFLIMGVVLVFSTLLILLNLAVDVLYRVVDPRIQD